MIDSRYHQQLAQVFSSATINALCHGEENPTLDYILNESGFSKYIPDDTSVGAVFEAIYAYLVKYYRNEYIYKNAIANKILIGRHSLKTSHLLSEFRVGSAKADLVILNGTSHVYEIKTEYDSTDRLANQIENYLRAFDRIHIVAHEKHLEKAREIVGDKVGLMVLTEKYTIRTIREAVSNKRNVAPEIIFDSLRRSEYCEILKAEFGFVPDVPNTRIFLECKKLFAKLDPEGVHDRLVTMLKNRGVRNPVAHEINALPQSLAMALLSYPIQPKQIQPLKDSLQSIYH